MSLSAFDVREFARNAAGCHRDGLTLARYEGQPLAPETLRCLRYLRDLERATMRYLRHVLVTPTHKNARITAFLTTWAFEKYWIADALDAILDHHGFGPLPATEQRSSRWVVGWQRARDRFAPIVRSLVDNAVGDHVIAVHMATGCIDEWLTDAAYQRIAQLAGHSELSRTIATVRGVKSRHLEFFEAEARNRLGRSRRPQRLTRGRLRRSRWPVSVTGHTSEEDVQFVRWVFAGDPSLVAELDRRVQTLPGLAALAPMHSTVAGSAGR